MTTTRRPGHLAAVSLSLSPLYKKREEPCAVDGGLVIAYSLLLKEGIRRGAELESNASNPPNNEKGGGSNGRNRRTTKCNALTAHKEQK